MNIDKTSSFYFTFWKEYLEKKENDKKREKIIKLLNLE